MSTMNDTCLVCKKAPSMRWDGIPICLRCFNAGGVSATGEPAKTVVTFGSGTSEDILTRHGAQLALAGHVNPILR
jgi:hypothetical protein